MTCYSCGRQGHTARLCRSVRPATTQSAPSAGGVTCFQCGQQGHVRRSCPQLQSQTQPAGPSTSQQTGVSVTQPPYQGQRQPALPAPQTSIASTSQSGPVASRGRGQQQGRVFTLGSAASPPDPVVRGTFFIFSSWARVLVDTGATHSFIAASFVTTLGLETSPLDLPLYVDTLIGG